MYCPVLPIVLGFAHYTSHVTKTTKALTLEAPKKFGKIKNPSDLILLLDLGNLSDEVDVENEWNAGVVLDASHGDSNLVRKCTKR